LLLLRPPARWRVGRLAPGIFALGLALATPACVGANAYTTPRSLEPGQTTVVVAPEIMHYRAEADGRDLYPETKAAVPRLESRQTGFSTVMPTVAIRYGVMNRLDAGIYLRSASVPGVDLKLNFLQTSLVDLAVRPGMQIMADCPCSSKKWWYYAELPLMASVHVGEAVDLVVSPGLGVAWGAEGREQGSGNFERRLPKGTMGRVGLGAWLRVSKGLAIFPEVTVANRSGDDSFSWVTAGIGFQLLKGSP
jgi:hypothetical protein